MTTALPHRARLVLTTQGGDHEFALAGRRCTIGRSELCDIVVPDDKVSRTHATIEYGAGRFELRDLASANGTLLNDQRVAQGWLAHGDRIRIGSWQLRFEELVATGDRAATRLEEAEEDPDTVERVRSLVHHDSHPCLVLSFGSETSEFPLTGEWLSIGRDAACDVIIPSDTVSRRHAQVERRGRAFVLRDLGSSNGTLVNGVRVTQQVLQNCDVIRVGAAHLVFKAGAAFDRLTLADAAIPTRARRRPVVFVPGLMGSELWRGSEQLWPAMGTLLFNTGALRYGEGPPVEARRVLQELVVVPKLISLDQYNRVGNYLEEEVGYRRGRDLLEFAYDWRQDVRQSARELGAAIEAWQARSAEASGPITIIAHSLGTLVSRYFVEVLGGAQKIERMVLVGGPHFGAPHIAAALAAGPNAFGLGGLSARLRDTLHTFPSVYQFLPTYPCVHTPDGNLYCPLEDDRWLPEASRPLMREAKRFRNELGTRFSVPTVCIYGYGIKTTTGVGVTGIEGVDWAKLKWLSDTGGDGSVPQVSAVLPGAEIHPVRQHHGSLYTDPDVRARLLLELTRESGR